MPASNAGHQADDGLGGSGQRTYRRFFLQDPDLFQRLPLGQGPRAASLVLINPITVDRDQMCVDAMA